MTAQNDNSECNDQITQTTSDFSIDHILNRAGNSASNTNFSFNICDSSTSSEILDPYAWLQCTRYCPPKVPRTQKRVKPQKRQLGRHPRIPFTSHQLSVLEEKFQQSPYLSSEAVIELARQLDLADVRVKIWFQNRRARERREKGQNDNTEKSSTSSSNSNNLTSPMHNVLFSHQTSAISNYLVAINNEMCFTNKDVR